MKLFGNSMSITRTCFVHIYIFFLKNQQEFIKLLIWLIITLTKSINIRGKNTDRSILFFQIQLLFSGKLDFWSI